jgi:DNA polymerase-3 subunit delta
VPLVTPAVVHGQIASGQPEPLYVLIGEDEAEKSAVAADFGSLVDEGLAAFNVDRLYGAETSVDELIEAANTLPMMSTRRVVIVLEAEKLLTPKRESKAAEEEQARLEAFLTDPPRHTALVFVCGALDQRRRVVKRLLAAAQVVDCGTIEDEAAAERWVKTRAARERIPVDGSAVAALVERSGLDIVRLRAGLERVALYAMGQKAITAADVKQAMPAGPEAQADFGIAKAIWRNDAREALHELGIVLDAGGSPFMVMGQLRAAAEKLAAPRLKDAIEAVFRTDLALKSSGGDQRILLERLVVELCGARDEPRRWPSRGAR